MRAFVAELLALLDSSSPVSGSLFLSLFVGPVGKSAKKRKQSRERETGATIAFVFVLGKLHIRGFTRIALSEHSGRL